MEEVLNGRELRDHREYTPLDVAWSGDIKMLHCCLAIIEPVSLLSAVVIVARIVRDFSLDPTELND